MIGASITISELREIGVKRISFGSLLSRAALGKLFRSAKEVLENGTGTFAKNAISFSELTKILNNKMIDKNALQHAYIE